MGIMGESKEPRSCWDGGDGITNPEDLSFHPDRYSSLQQLTLPIIYTRLSASPRHRAGGIFWLLRLKWYSVLTVLFVWRHVTYICCLACLLLVSWEHFSACFTSVENELGPLVMQDVSWAWHWLLSLLLLLAEGVTVWWVWEVEGQSSRTQCWERQIMSTYKSA